MKQSNEKSFKCLFCEKPTNTLHEIFYGGADKALSVKYNLQAPVCNECHLKSHKNKKKGQLAIFKKYDICFIDVSSAVAKRDYAKLIEYSEVFKGKILSREI